MWKTPWITTLRRSFWDPLSTWVRGQGAGGRGQGAGKDCMCSSEPWTCTKKTVSSVLECLGELFGPQVGQEYCWHQSQPLAACPASKFLEFGPWSRTNPWLITIWSVSVPPVPGIYHFWYYCLHPHDKNIPTARNSCLYIYPQTWPNWYTLWCHPRLAGKPGF